MTAALHWPLLLLLAAQLFQAAPAPQIWQCAPCSADNLSLCPPVPTSCSEVTRPAGCGCCPVCALQLEEACGVTTARCARGLRCRARPGESRPLYALTQGRGICMRELDETSTEATGNVRLYSCSAHPIPSQGWRSSIAFRVDRCRPVKAQSWQPKSAAGTVRELRVFSGSCMTGRGHRAWQEDSERSPISEHIPTP